jgi:hypothetical protein
MYININMIRSHSLRYRSLERSSERRQRSHRYPYHVYHTKHLVQELCPVTVIFNVPTTLNFYVNNIVFSGEILSLRFAAQQVEQCGKLHNYISVDSKMKPNVCVPIQLTKPFYKRKQQKKDNDHKRSVSSRKPKHDGKRVSRYLMTAFLHRKSLLKVV